MGAHENVVICLLFVRPEGVDFFFDLVVAAAIRKRGERVKLKDTAADVAARCNSFGFDSSTKCER